VSAAVVRRVVCSLVSCDALTPRRFKAWRDVLPDKLVAKMDPELRAMNQYVELQFVVNVYICIICVVRFVLGN